MCVYFADILLQVAEKRAKAIDAAEAAFIDAKVDQLRAQQQAETAAKAEVHDVC